MTVGALVVVAGLLAGGGAVGCSSPAGRTAAKVALEAAGVIAASPFAQDANADLKGVKAVTGARSRGAFGGTPGTTRCDKAKLIGQITADRVKAEAWAKIRGVAVDRIADHIKGLIEEIVPEDTLVKNHNYQGDGKTVAYPSVLQAGTAILRQRDDESPAVKCNCGNPLLQPDKNIDREKSTYVGQRWESFQVTQITVIVVRDADEGPRKKVQYVDVRHPDRGFDRPTGTDGSADSTPYPVPPPKAPPSPSRSASGSGSASPSGSESPSASDSPSSGTPSTGGPTTSKPPSVAPSSPSPGKPSTSKPAPTVPRTDGPTRVPPATSRAPEPTRTALAPSPARTITAAPTRAVTREPTHAVTREATREPTHAVTREPTHAVPREPTRVPATPEGGHPPGPARSALP